MTYDEHISHGIETTSQLIRAMGLAVVEANDKVSRAGPPLPMDPAVNELLSRFLWLATVGERIRELEQARLMAQTSRLRSATIRLLDVFGMTGEGDDRM